MHYDTPQQDSPQETIRRLENVARVGTITEVRHTGRPRCRVRLGDNTTDWLPWLTGRAAGNNGSSWWPPEPGEQCVVIAPGGDLAQGVVLIGAYSDAMPAPANEARMSRTQWTTEAFAEYRSEQHITHTERAIVMEAGGACRIAMELDSITMTVGDGCRIAMEPGGITMTVGGAVLHIGPDGITSTVDIRAQGVSAVSHIHNGVTKGPDKSKEPVR